MFFQLGSEFGAFECNILFLTRILGEVIELNTTKSVLFEFRDPGLLKVIQFPKLRPQSISFGIGEVPVEHAGSKIHSVQFFLKIIAEDLLDLFHESIRSFNVNW